MATHEVPGYNAANNDSLHDGCWAESGSKLLSVDRLDDQVHFSLYANDGLNVTRSSLPPEEFARAFSGGDWLWHDKSPKPERAILPAPSAVAA